MFVGLTRPAGLAPGREDAHGPSETHRDSALRTSTAERTDLAVQHTAAASLTHLRQVPHIQDLISLSIYLSELSLSFDYDLSFLSFKILSLFHLGSDFIHSLICLQ